MATQVQNRRGTTAEHSTFTGANGELTVDTTKRTLVVHDGATAGGRPLLREDQSNLPTSAPTTGFYNASGALAISTSGTGRLFVDSSGRVGVGASPSVNLHVIGTADTIARVTAANGTTAVLDLGTVAAPTAGRIAYDNGNNLTFSTNASERLRITSDGKLGLGTSTFASGGGQGTGPSTQTAGSIYIYEGGNAEDHGGAVAFGINTFPTYAPMAQIKSLLKNAVTGELQGSLGFFTRPIGAAGQSLTRRMTITSDGRVGVGTTPGYNLDVKGASGADVSLRLTSNNSNDYSSRIFFGDNVSDRGAIVYNNFANSLAFTVNASEAFRVDSSRRLLVGTSSAAGFVTESTTAKVVIAGNTSGFTQQGEMVLLNGVDTVLNNFGLGVISFAGETNAQVAASISAAADGEWNTSGDTTDSPGRLVLSTTADGESSPTARMRISSNGSCFHYPSTDGFILGSAATAGTSVTIYRGRHSATGINTGTDCFYVFSNGNVANTNNSYGAISDIKLKENIVDATSQWNDIKSLQVRKYNFKEGQTHTQIGLVAQEVELVSPGLVTESPDRDSEGNDLGTVTKSVNYSVLYMKAVKALQEAMERIETLEAKVAALESA